MPVTTITLRLSARPGQVCVPRLLARRPSARIAPLVDPLSRAAPELLAQMAAFCRVSRILTGQDLQKWLLAGPCSAWLFILAPGADIKCCLVSRGYVCDFRWQTQDISARLPCSGRCLAGKPDSSFYGAGGRFYRRGCPLKAVGLVWLWFLWFWIAGLRQAGGKKKTHETETISFLQSITLARSGDVQRGSIRDGCRLCPPVDQLLGLAAVAECGCLFSVNLNDVSAPVFPLPALFFPIPSWVCHRDVRAAW